MRESREASDKLPSGRDQLFVQRLCSAPLRDQGSAAPGCGRVFMYVHAHVWDCAEVSAVVGPHRIVHQHLQPAFHTCGSWLVAGSWRAHRTYKIVVPLGPSGTLVGTLVVTLPLPGRYFPLLGKDDDVRAALARVGAPVLHRGGHAEHGVEKDGMLAVGNRDWCAAF